MSRGDRAALDAERVRRDLQRPVRYEETITGNAVKTVWTIKHHLTARAPHVAVQAEAAPYTYIVPGIVGSANDQTVTLTFAIAPGVGVKYRVRVSL